MEAQEQELVEIAKKRGAVSVGVASRKDEIPRRWLARVLGFPRQFVRTYMIDALFTEKMDSVRFAAEVNAFCTRHECRVEWRLLPLVWCDKKALPRAGN